MRMIIFFAVFSFITGLISYYFFIRGLQSIPAGSGLRYPYIVVFWMIAFSYIGGRILENRVPAFASDILLWIGSFWIAATIYFLLAVAMLDLVRLANHFLHFYPAVVTNHYQKSKFILMLCVTGVVGVLLLIGHINAILPRIVTMHLSVPRKASRLDQLNIVAVSDIHLGTIVGRSRFDQIVDRINRLNPDVVLLPGDIVDEDIAPVIRQNLGESLKNIHSRYGVFGVTGNHEHIGGAERACEYLVAHGITMLRDRSVKVADSFVLVGREDRSSVAFGGNPRKSLSELMESADTTYPIILMDHQPFRLSEAADLNVDLQLSGHTHYGQLWPINYIVDRVYELAWGYKRKGNTQYYVSCGVGTWGPPVRIGNRPEIVQFQIQFR
jgi:uncharacterized protein